MVSVTRDKKAENKSKIHWSILSSIPSVINHSVYKQLKKLDQEKYMILKDLIIKDHDNRKIKMDYVVVSEYGIFVIYFKNLKGLVYGYETDYRWFHNNHGHIKKFFNPIFQNQRRIQALKNTLNYYSFLTFHNIIVFPYRTSILIETLFDANLIHVNELYNKISDHKDTVVFLEEKEKISKTLLDKDMECKKEIHERINELIRLSKRKNLNSTLWKEKEMSND